jgi:hypothetical protein
VDAAATLELRGRSKTTMMNQLPTMLSLVLLVTLPETSVAADTNLQADGPQGIGAVPDFPWSDRHVQHLHPGAVLGVRVHDRAWVPKAV